MNYAQRLERVAVLGAAGKMGSGIVLLTAMEMADLALDPENKGMNFTLQAVDVSSAGLSGLMKYLRNQVLKAAEKKAVGLRKAYEGREDLVENEEIIRQHVDDVLALIRPTTRLESANDATLVFEAVNENPALKVKLLSQIATQNAQAPWFFTNTSSIPIHELDAAVKLGGRIVGFHFYNPPAVQKLVEVIRADSTLPEVGEFAQQFAKRLRKTVVPSHDVAGFIGNGHFMRDALYGIAEVERLAGELGFPEAVYAVNKVTQDYLIRPMGIFQLIDYVGLDVCQYIMTVMADRLPGAKLHSPVLDEYIAAGVLGGQFADGSQKDGILKYEKGRPTAVYDLAKKVYVPVAELAARVDGKLGAPPAGIKPWKAVIGDADKGKFLEGFFSGLKGRPELGARLAVDYGRKSKEIGLGLVRDKVAAREDDVNTVLLTGFYHAYGPINPYFD
jgi:3-hydroxyacyl-CoA dehydrogenase